MDLGAEKDFKRLVLPQRTQRRDLKDYLIARHFRLWLGQAPQILVLTIGIAENAYRKIITLHTATSYNSS